MNIYFNNLFYVNLNSSLLSDKLSISSLKQKVALLALIIFGSVLAFYYFTYYRFKAERIDFEEMNPSSDAATINIDRATKEKDSKKEITSPKEKKEELKDQHSPKLVEESEDCQIRGQSAFKTPKKDPLAKISVRTPPFLQISPGKANALKSYRSNPKKLSNIHKIIIFKDIQSIESSSHGKKNSNAIVDIMLYVSGLSEVDLSNTLCAQVVVDSFKGCNKETSKDLCEWLGKQETFNVDLLKNSLTIFIDKYYNRLPLNFYSIELLIKIYIKREWSELRDSENNLVLPSNHKVIVSAMTVLIQDNPNDDRIIALTEWMMKQPEFDLQSFSVWIKIFQQREKEKGATNLYYPLLDKLIAHFQKNWGVNSLEKLDKSVMAYLQSKDPNFKPI